MRGAGRNPSASPGVPSAPRKALLKVHEDQVIDGLLGGRDHLTKEETWATSKELEGASVGG